MEGWLKLGGGGVGGLHSWPFHEKKGATMGVSQEEGSIMHGYTKPKATSKQCLSKLSLTELQTTGKAHYRKKTEKGKKKNKQEHRDITPDKSLDCVMTSAGTLKPNFSKAFKTLLKTNHSCSLEVK